jgi:thiol-disulfide isomerase/thioredoxin
MKSTAFLYEEYATKFVMNKAGFICLKLSQVYGKIKTLESKGGLMFKKIFILIFISIFFIACQAGKEDFKNFNDEYVKLTQKLRDQRSKVKTRDEYVAFKAEKKKGYEDLLKKFEKSPAVDDIEILRSRVLLNLSKLDEAEKKIDAVLAKDPDNIIDAKVVKMKVLLERKKYGDAFEIFKVIESQIKDTFDLFGAYYAFGTEHEDNKIKEQYATKFLNAKEIPQNYQSSKPDMYLVLSSIAKQEGDFEKARKLLNDGVTTVGDNERTKKFLQKTAAQLDYIGKKAFSIPADSWLNSEKLDLDGLKGKVVIVAFWAPWCPSCRQLQPTLVDLYNENKDKDFSIIGFTRFYGNYRDDEKDAGKVTKEEELEEIKGYLARKNISYPIAIANEKTVYNNYSISGIPTMIFIDKNGNVDFTKIGGGNVDFIKDKIRKLLEES